MHAYFGGFFVFICLFRNQLIFIFAANHDMKLSMAKILNEIHEINVDEKYWDHLRSGDDPAFDNNQTFNILKKADDMVHEMTVNFDESINPKDVFALLDAYFKFRKMGHPEPSVDGKRGDYLANQISAYLKHGDK